MSQKPLVYIAALLLVVVAAGAQAAPVTLYYPDQENADFSVAVPGDWELEQAEEEGGFFTVTGPTGAQLSFRTVETGDDEIDAAMEQSMEWVFANYSDVKLDDPEDIVQNGMEGFNMTGTAKNEGSPVVIVMAWLALKRSHLAEVLIVVDATDRPGLNAAERVIKTLRRR
ncbi:MAG TPA: hypothetical protein VEK57_13855 [Thermoanaerobaculia bacterium]|nr:hypothetical protein [Thermoanaerobaculia bacterium]